MSEKPVTRRSKVLTRIPPPRVKRILQTDEEIGKMANPVPAVIARSLEVFIEKLLTKSVDVTQHRLAKTLSPQHIKECVKMEPTFRFLFGVVSTIPDHGSESGHSTVTTGSSMDSYFTASTSTSGGSVISHCSGGPKRRGSKHTSLADSHDGKPPAKTARRGKAQKRSFEFDADTGDLSDKDDLSGGEFSGVKLTLTQQKAPNRKPSVKSNQKKQQQDVYELGPTLADDVPDDPSTS